MNKSPEHLSVSIVIPNWNGVYLMQKHLRRVLKAAPGAQIIVADDHSSDGSIEYLRTNFPDIEVTTHSVQTGFAGNVNTGVQKAHGDIIVLLNTDVEPEIGFLKPLLRHFSDPDVFAVGCMEKSFENGTIVLRGRGAARWENGYYIHSKGDIRGTNTAWVSGGSAAFRHSMWKELQGMDNLYNPFYWEDIDLSYRARKYGWRTLFEPESIINHYHEEGKIKSVYSADDVKRISYRNQYIFIWKNLTDRTIFAAHVFWLPVRLIQSLLHGDALHMQGFFMAFSMIIKILRKRQQLKKRWVKEDAELTVT